ncbi:Hydroquinone glucosyltransferase, partial [Mucuna pruriens]
SLASFIVDSSEICISMGKRTHIVVIPSAGFSHLAPIVHFSKRVVELHPDINITCIIPTLGSLPSAAKTILETLPPNINSIFLPPINPNDLPQGIPVVLQIQFAMSHSMSSIHHTLKSLTSNTNLVAMVVDTFAYQALDFARQFNMLSYVYFPSAATTLCTHFYLPTLDAQTTCEYRDLKDPVKVPGCVPFHGTDLYVQAQDRFSDLYKISLKRYERYRFVDGIFVNSFFQLETGPIMAFRDEEKGYPPLYPVGPIVQTGTGSAKGLECVTWLDKQQAGSVLYVSFGSGGTLSQEQITELAYGLELSNHKFLWVVRAPSSLASDAAYIGEQKHVDPLEFLPCGFLERTKEQGMVVPSWAPQIQVLSHSSVGGFLTHCGWNSTLESVLKGVPLITWPLFAEQKMNAVVLSEGLKVGVRPRVSENGLVKRMEIVRVIKCLMEGKEGREMDKRMKKLREAAINGLKQDGDSTKNLSQATNKVNERED